MLLKESELDDLDIIRPILGSPYKESGKLLTVTGSTIYFTKECTDLEGNPLSLKRKEMKAIFQRYEKGLMLFFTKSNYQNAILISKKDIKSIKLYKNIVKRPLLNNMVLKVLLLLSTIPILRFFALLFIYKTRETVLEIETHFFRAKMITSYSSFNSQVKYFSNLELADRLQISLPN